MNKMNLSVTSVLHAQLIFNKLQRELNNIADQNSLNCHLKGISGGPSRDGGGFDPKSIFG